MKYEFKMIDEHGNSSVNMSCEHVCLDNLLQDFKEFLRGVGFIIPYNAELEVVELDDE